MELYNPKQIESKWQEKWEGEGAPRAKDFDSKPKRYYLVEFPYPSGAGLHVGHVRSYTALDVMARKARMEGFNVLYPIGWDAFGLPTENYAIKNKIHPRQATEKNIAVFRQQLKQLGISFDWSREVNTTDPDYYKWTQWIFLQMFKHGLAYKAKMPINWCPSCKIGLANEEVVNRSTSSGQASVCERCGTETERREKEQWMLKITAYADRLLDDLETVDYSERIRASQVNWIGKSEGAEIAFKITSGSPSINSGTDFIEVFTTRPDTLYGATYVVLAPEHEIISKLQLKIENWAEVERYLEEAKKKTEIERVAEGKEKTGVEIKGIKAVNPANGEEMPVFAADYVLAGYGTGAIMAVPGHDNRDFEFAKKYGLPVVKVIEEKGLDSRSVIGNDKKKSENDKMSDREDVKEVYEGDGVLVNSGEFDGMESEEAKDKITKKVGGKKTVHYHLRDWIFSRQHYWGEPIPIIYCRKCWETLNSIRQSADETLNADFIEHPRRSRDNIKTQNSKLKEGFDYVVIDGIEYAVVPVGEGELPVELPEVESYEPTETGESPLSAMEEWVKIKCPKCGGEARRETDTMPNWAGSSWYYLAYATRGISNDEFLISKNKEVLKYWMPVDLYNGGMEHTTLHLLYSRFWYKFLYDIGAVPKEVGPEPYARRRSHGVVLAEDGRKMSKSYGNVVNPDEIAERYGADALRLYELFMGPFSDAIPWSTNGLKGVRRFLERVWSLKDKVVLPQGQGLKNDLKKLMYKTIKKVGEDIEAMKFNTAVSQLMIAANGMAVVKELPRELWEKFVKILAPLAPHLAEELWEGLENKESVFREGWPEYDEEALCGETVMLAVQVDGKLRALVEVSAGATEEQAVALVREEEKIKVWLAGKTVRKTIFVPDKLINFVT